jgi:hypothetical protein
MFRNLLELTEHWGEEEEEEEEEELCSLSQIKN